MKTSRLRGMVALALVGGVALAGCENEHEDGLEMTTGAFTASQCSTASPVKSVAGVPYTWTSSSSYGGACNAVDDTVGTNPASYLAYGSWISGDQLPTNQADCQAVTMRTVFYKNTGSGWVVVKDESASGVWGGLLGCSITPPGLTPLGAGVGIRVATTVRRPSGTSFVTYPFTTDHLRKPQ